MGPLSLVWGLASSPIGRAVAFSALVAAAGAGCFGWGYLKARDACKDAQAAALAAQLRAQLEERARQAKASAADVAEDAQKAKATFGAQTAMQAEIDRLKAELSDREKEAANASEKGSKSTVVVKGCGGNRIDSDYARRVRQLDRAGGR